MAETSAQYATRMLQAARDAYEVVISGRGIQEYQIGGGSTAFRRFVRMTTGELLEQIEHWERKVNALAAATAGKSRRLRIFVRQPQ